MASMASPALKRVNFVISERAHATLLRIAHDTNRSMTDIIKLGLGLAQIVLEEMEKDNRIVVTTQTGQPVKELVLPPL